jgi:hypothetical protein
LTLMDPPPGVKPIGLK